MTGECNISRVLRGRKFGGLCTPTASLSSESFWTIVDELFLRITPMSQRVQCVEIVTDEPLVALIAELAAWHAGLCTVILSPTTPGWRLADIEAKLPGRISIDSCADPLNPGSYELHTRECSEPTVTLDSYANPAYILFTSGSTGAPKGVVISHEALISRIEGMSVLPGVTSQDVFAALSAPCFDIALGETLLPMYCGASVAAFPSAARRRPDIFGQSVLSMRPTIIQGTPSFWRTVVRYGWQPSGSAPAIWCGGECLTPDLAADLLLRTTELWNLYGPTEAVIWATAGRISEASDTTIGGGIPGTATRVSHGELELGGRALADGYLNDPESSAKCFYEDTQGKWYRTGDLCRWRPGDSLEFCGRRDSQVKVRGHRIELEDVRQALRRVSFISDAAVAALGADGGADRRLGAMLVTSAHVAKKTLRQQLTAALPEYMWPSEVLVVDSLPTTSNGKLDLPAVKECLERLGRSRAESAATRARQE